MRGMPEITELAKTYATARETLRVRMMERESELDEIREKYDAGLWEAAGEAHAAELLLREAIAESRELFEKPRTQVIEGIKCGFRRTNGSLVWGDDTVVVERISELFPDQFDTLVKVSSKPLRKGLEQLSVAELKRLGVTVRPGSDQVVCVAQDGCADAEVDRLIARVE